MPFTVYTVPMAGGLAPARIEHEWTRCSVAYGHAPRPEQWAKWLAEL